MTGTSTVKQKNIGRDKKYPYKRQINLMYRERKTRDTVFTLVLFGIYLVFLYFFTRYGVMKQLSLADQAERIYSEKQKELTELQEQNNEYSDVRAEFSHYGDSYMTDDEKAQQDMVTMLNIIDERIHKVSEIQSVNVSANVAEIRLGIPDADDLPKIINSLEESEFINYVTAQTASTTEKNYRASVVDEEGNVSEPRYVDASITVYFRSPAEVETALSSGNETAVDAYLDASPTGAATGSNAYVPIIMPRPVIEVIESGEGASGNNTDKSGSNSGSGTGKNSGTNSGSSSKNSSNSSSSGSGNSSSSSSSKSSSKSSTQAQQQAAAQAAAQQAAAQQAAAAQAAAQAAAAAQAQAQASSNQNVYIDTPGYSQFGSGSISIQSGSPLG